MSALSRATDLVYAYRFIKLLVQPWENTDAYKLGIIDGSGKVLKRRRTSSAEKNAYTPFVRLVFNIKKLLDRVPGSNTRLGSLATALYLIKEHTGMTDQKIIDSIKRAGYEPPKFPIYESMWLLGENKYLSKGIYKTSATSLDTDTGDIIREGSTIVVEQDTPAVGFFFGYPIFEAYHVNSKKFIKISPLQLKS